jgi:hypothetical protein
MANRFATYAMADKTFKNALVSIRTRGTNLARDTHKASIAAMLYSLPPAMGGSLNADPALRLCQHIADGQPRNKVVLWFNYFTNVRISVKTGADGAVTWTVKNLSPKNADGSPNANFKVLTDDLIQQAIDTPYWKLNPEPDVAPVDIEKLITNAIKKIEKARNDGKLVADARNESRLAGLKALVGGVVLAAPVEGRSVPKKVAKKATAKAVGAKAGKVVAEA